MKKWIVAAAAAVLLPTAAWANEAALTSGSAAADEWGYLTQAQRQERISTAIGLLEQRGAVVMKNSYDYAAKMDAYLRSDAAKEDKNVDTAIFHLIYDTEPQTRPAILAIVDDYVAAHSGGAPSAKK